MLVEKNLGQKKFDQTKIKATEKLSPKSLVKIVSVTAEILLICTSVARTYVAWTNVLASVTDGPRNLPLMLSSGLIYVRIGKGKIGNGG